MTPVLIHPLKFKLQMHLGTIKLQFSYPSATPFPSVKQCEAS